MKLEYASLVAFLLTLLCVAGGWIFFPWKALKAEGIVQMNSTLCDMFTMQVAQPLHLLQALYNDSESEIMKDQSAKRSGYLQIL